MEPAGTLFIFARKHVKYSIMLNKLVCGTAFVSCLSVLPSSGPIISSHSSAEQAVQEQTQLVRKHNLYVGVELAAQAFNTTSTTYPMMEAVVRPLYIFVGYQTGPRNAVQLGFIQQSQPDALVNTVSTNRAGQPTTTYSYYHEYRAAVPVLLRHNLIQPIHRVQLDALLGATFVVHNYQNDYIATAGGQVTNEAHDRAFARNLNATVGLGAGFAVVARVVLMVEGTASLNLKTLESGYLRKFTYGVGAGLRYRFALKKKAAASAGS